jgi:hypothetical protein
MLELRGFVDGNGRLARFLANREPVAAGFHPMVLSNSMRRRSGDVPNGLRQRGDLRELAALFAEGAEFAAEIAKACAIPGPDFTAVTARRDPAFGDRSGPAPLRRASKQRGRIRDRMAVARDSRLLPSGRDAGHIRRERAFRTGVRPVLPSRSKIV